MKSKKVLIPVVLLTLVLIIAGIFTFNKKSNTETTNKETSVTDSEDSSNPRKEETPNSNSSEVSSNSNKDTESKDNAAQNKESSNNSTNDESNKDSNTSTNSDTNSSTTNSDTVNTIFSEKDAANTLLIYLLGNEELNPKCIIPVALANETNVATPNNNSNIFFYTSEPLTDKTTDGIIITISDYNSENKTYKYELRDYADLLQKEDMILAQGTVAKNGEVTSD